MRRLDITTSKEEIVCDNSAHSTEQPAHGQLTIHFWYGSKHSMKQGTLHLCDECADDVLFLLKKEFKLKDFLKPIEEF